MSSIFQRVLPSALMKDDWLISPKVSKLFFASALCVVMFTLEYIIGDTSKAPHWQNVVWDILGVIEPFGIFFIWFGMWRYWVRLDGSKPYVKRLWFVVLLVGFWWASVLYYSCVYLPQMIRRRRAEA